jgi:hypothetical protein
MRAVTRAVLALTVCFTAVGAAVSSMRAVAWADGGTGCSHSQLLNVCHIGTGTQPRPGHTTSTQPIGSTGSSGPACHYTPQPGSGTTAGSVPCHAAAGYWSNSYSCYISAMKPPPAATDPSWAGHQPGDGAVYACYDPKTQILIPIWAGGPPQGPGQQVTPEQLAQSAIKKLTMRAIGVGLAPTPTESNPSAMGVIGIPVWMWVQDPNAATYGPLTASASAGGITVTAAAEVERVQWDMGDGSSPIDCRQGTPYSQSADQARQSPDCGYIYTRTSWDKPNHKYAVTARSYWRVDWTGGGQQGTIRLPALVSTVHVKEGELQVLNSRG